MLLSNIKSMQTQVINALKGDESKVRLPGNGRNKKGHMIGNLHEGCIPLYI